MYIHSKKQKSEILESYFTFPIQVVGKLCRNTGGNSKISLIPTKNFFSGG